MATRGALAEFARMPPQRKVMLFAVIGLALGLLYWKFAYQALDEELAIAQAEHDRKVLAQKKLADDLPRYEELRARMATLRELIEKNQTALPSEPEVPAFFETLQRKVAESGAEIHKWTNRPEEPVESFVKVPVEVEMSGTFMQIKRFFASLIQKDVRLARAPDEAASEEPERIVSIENLALTRPTLRDREIVLTARFTAVTFRQEDQVTPDSQPAGPRAPGTPRPAAPGPGAEPPPLPSAMTPAGARAQVEDAIEKADARNRNASSGEAAPPRAAAERRKGDL